MSYRGEMWFQPSRHCLAVMVGPVPTIHVFGDAMRVRDVDARHKGEHDGTRSQIDGLAV
ncbi:hypothetical protein [Bosea sp. ANAM02]|uniref:hypothetical protein n=1 Tax=Bosea sp. ANAM02 TaxID=2020412 RepID=UPI001563C98C|nr:hypothetical protein [Bosea sp. ANAM02]